MCVFFWFWPLHAHIWLFIVPLFPALIIDLKFSTAFQISSQYHFDWLHTEPSVALISLASQSGASLVTFIPICERIQTKATDNNWESKQEILGEPLWVHVKINHNHITGKKNWIRHLLGCLKFECLHGWAWEWVGGWLSFYHRITTVRSMCRCVRLRVDVYSFLISF